MPVNNIGRIIQAYHGVIVPVDNVAVIVEKIIRPAGFGHIRRVVETGEKPELVFYHSLEVQ